MDPFEVDVRGELFRISERAQPGSSLSYDFVWLNGPAEGTYGFTVGKSTIVSSGGPLNADACMAQEELVAEVRGFVEGFYTPGGLGEEDFPDHVPAQGCNGRDK